MRIDANRLRQMREERLWSQEQVAEIAGLSTRTVQRAESGGAASAETAMSLAAAFDVRPAALRCEKGEIDGAEHAEKAAQLRLSFHIHLATFIFVAGLLIAIDLTGTPDRIWTPWPLIGWGIGVAAHGLASFIATRTAEV